MEQKKAANPSIEEVLAEKDANKQKEIYNEYVSNMTPKHSCFWNCIKAFLVGGSICLLGEILIQWYQSMGNDRELAGLYGTLSLILISILLTGFNVYQRLGQFGRCRKHCSDHRICKFCSIAGFGVWRGR